MTTTRWYAGIGSRDTPEDVLQLMETVAEQLANTGWGLRSGGARGADSAFERGASNADGVREIFLPVAGFNGRADGIDASKLPARPKRRPSRRGFTRRGHVSRSLVDV